VHEHGPLGDGLSGPAAGSSRLPLLDGNLVIFLIPVDLCWGVGYTHFLAHLLAGLIASCHRIKKPSLRLDRNLPSLPVL
jgi:hypothetical protein